MKTDKIVDAIEDAGAAREKDSERDGFLSYAYETHALGMGISAGFMATAYGDTALLSLVYAAAVYGKAKEKEQSRRKILKQIAAEMHYALAGIVVGAMLGMLTRVVNHYIGIPASIV